MQLRLQEVDFADCDEIALVQATAQADEAFHKALHPGLRFEDALVASKARWLSVYGFSSWYYKKVVDSETGKIVGYSRWGMDEKHRALLPAPTGVPEGAEIPPRQKPTSLDFELAGQLGEQSDAIAEKYIGGRDSMYVDNCCVLPDYRNQGVEDLMLGWATAFADEQDMPCTADADAEAISMYLENGFEKIDEIKLRKDGVVVVALDALKREPKQKAS